MVKTAPLGYEWGAGVSPLRTIMGGARNHIATPPVGSATRSPSEVSLADLAAAFEHAPVGMAITDEGAVLIHANAALADILGYTVEELVGKSIVDLTYAEDLAASLASTKRLARGEITRFSLEKRYVHKSGRLVWARVYVSLLTKEGRRHHLLHVADITGEKASTEVLRETEARFREMAESIEQDFWVLHLDPPELLYSSPAAERIWGFDPMVNRDRPERIAECVHPDDLTAFAELFDGKLLAARECEYRIVRVDGEPRWLRTRVFPIVGADGSIDRVTGLTEDVTPRKEAEQRVERHRAFERLVMELSAGFVNTPPERMQEGFEHALGELGKLIGADAGAIFLVDDGAETMSMRYAWSAEPAAIGPAVLTDLRFGPQHPLRAALMRDGLLCVSDVASLPDEVAEIRDLVLAYGARSFIDVPLVRRGEMIGLYGFGTISRSMVWSDEVAERLKIVAELFCNALDRVRAEKEACTHRDALAHTLRVGTMGQLASGIAHELNQPLAAILNYASGCERRIAAGDIGITDLQEAIQRIAEQAVRAAEVIKTLRALVRKGERTRTWHDPNELVRTALSFIETEAAGAGVAIVVESATAAPKVQVDPIQIEQVVLNLVRNAIDAVRSLHNGTDPMIRVTTRITSSNLVTVSVTDNGPGVAASHKDFIFDEFYSTKATGLGLGLSISRSIIEAHGGRLWMAASSPSGATFCFTLAAAS